MIFCHDSKTVETIKGLDMRKRECIVFELCVDMFGDTNAAQVHMTTASKLATE